MVYMNQLRNRVLRIPLLICQIKNFHQHNVLNLAIERQNLNGCICALSNARQFSITSFAWKDKNRGKEKSKAEIPKKLDTSELETVLDVDELRTDFERHLDHLKEDFLLHVSLRTTGGSLENLKIKYKNKQHTLNELARISRKPKDVILDFSVNPEAIPIAIDALRSSQMRLSPTTDGYNIIVPIPKVTKEYRETLAKAAKTFCQKHSGNIKNVRNATVKMIMDADNIPKDQRRRLEQTIDTLSKMYIQEAEKILQAKQKELNKSIE